MKLDVSNKNFCITIVGAGYVGLPLAYEFSKVKKVYSYDIDLKKINILKTKKEYKNINFTNKENCISKSNAIIVAVPTPIDKYNKPDLTCLKSACKLIGENINKGSLVIFESSYMAGTTNNICIPLLEKYSNLKYNDDFYVGYSPERINPTDNIHTLKTITKVVSANDKTTLQYVYDIYSLIDSINLKPVENIEVAELSKMVENSQRDVNIAFINEVAKLCNSLDIDTYKVLDVAKTKWNFYDVKPGLVGGHCIAVDPFYLIDSASYNGVEMNTLKEARKTNDSMSGYIVNVLKEIINANCISKKKKIKIGIMGYSYKENSNDIRNTKVSNIAELLYKENYTVEITDYLVGDLNNSFVEQLSELDVLILAVAHDKYKIYDVETIVKMFNNSDSIKVILDLKHIYHNYKFPNNFIYWCL